MHETLWDLRQIKERRDEIAREIEEVRLARSHTGKRGRLRSFVARLLGARLLGEAPSAVCLSGTHGGWAREPEEQEKGPSPGAPT